MSGQNTSSAVMQQRNEPHDSLDFFPTPPWGTRALCELLVLHGVEIGALSAWDPACGEGHMVRPLAEYFAHAVGSDVHPYGFGYVHDFVFPGPAPFAADWIITNPPFRLGAEFIVEALDIAQQGVAMLVRSAFLEGIERHREIFAPRPPWAVAQFTERVPMVKGRYDPKASSATSYCWIIWRKDIAVDHTRMLWIPPSRKRLERERDWKGMAE